MQRNWINNLGDAVPTNTDDACYGILSAAHEGAQRASDQCGIFFVPYWEAMKWLSMKWLSIRCVTPGAREGQPGSTALATRNPRLPPALG